MSLREANKIMSNNEYTNDCVDTYKVSDILSDEEFKEKLENSLEYDPHYKKFMRMVILLLSLGAALIITEFIYFTIPGVITFDILMILGVPIISFISIALIGALFYYIVAEEISAKKMSRYIKQVRDEDVFC